MYVNYSILLNILMNTEKPNYTDSIKYFSITWSTITRKVTAKLRQLKIVITKSNRILRLSNCCSTDERIALFCSYYDCFYCLFLWTHY